MPSKSVEPFFEVGNEVEWTSQAGGHVKTKRGVIVAVVREGDNPQKCLPAGTKLDGPGLIRYTRSYLVQVGKSRALYWPRVTNLKRVEA